MKTTTATRFLSQVCALTHYSLLAIAALSVGLFVTPTAADNFNFDISYLGNGNTQLAPGSDEPDGQALVPGDTFQWTIASADDRFWLVETTGGFFPLMAFDVDPGGIRTGDFTLVLRNDGVDVFTLSEIDEVTQEVHLGTNTVNLTAGLQFDEMFLDYALVSSVELGDPSMDVTTTISGRLPIFGTPENNIFSPGIVYVPEPTAAVLFGVGCCGGVLTRRRH